MSLAGGAIAAPPPDAPSLVAPVEVRDDWLLAGGRLQLPAASPDTLAPGCTELDLAFELGNDFGWDQSTLGEAPGDRRFLVDGEHGLLAMDVRRGLGRRFDASLRVGLAWRDGGFLDGVIDAWHRWLGPVGVRDNGRPFFFTDLLRVEGRRPDGTPIAWTGGEGTGLADSELSLRYALSRGEGWRSAVVTRVLVPTGTNGFGGGGWDAGVQLVAARALSSRFDLTLDLGVTRFGTRERHGITYTWGQVHGHATLGWRPSESWALQLQLRASSRLIEDVAAYPGMQSYVDISAGKRFGRWRVVAGFSENVVSQQATVDFSVHVRLGVGF